MLNKKSHPFEIQWEYTLIYLHEKFSSCLGVISETRSLLIVYLLHHKTTSCLGMKNKNMPTAWAYFFCLENYALLKTESTNTLKTILSLPSLAYWFCRCQKLNPVEIMTIIHQVVLWASQSPSHFDICHCYRRIVIKLIALKENDLSHGSIIRPHSWCACTSRNLYEKLGWRVTKIVSTFRGQFSGNSRICVSDTMVQYLFMYILQK